MRRLNEENTMNCSDCKHWHSDEQDRANSIRGYCGEPRADKAGARTVRDYSCRHHENIKQASEKDETITIRYPTGWDGYVYHGTTDLKISKNCPLCGRKLNIWWSRYYDGTIFDQIEGCEGGCDARDIYKEVKKVIGDL
jgi:hypothetical protein